MSSLSVHDSGENIYPYLFSLTGGGWRSNSSLLGEHGRPCCSLVSRRAYEVDRMHASRRACAADCSHASFQVCTADFSCSSRLIKQLHTCHRVWLNFDTVNIIQPFPILTCQLFVSKRTLLATNVCASSQTGRFFTTAYMCHVMKPCQFSCFFGDFLIYWDLKTKIFSGRRQVCNSFPFLK